MIFTILTLVRKKTPHKYLCAITRFTNLHKIGLSRVNQYDFDNFQSCSSIKKKAQKLVCSRGEWCYFDHTGNSTGRLFVINKHKLVVVFLTKINVLLIQLKSK